MKRFPYHKQETGYTCGAASMRMILEYLGIKKSERQIAKLLETNKVRGTWPKYFPELAERYKLDYIVERKATIKDIKHLLNEGYLVIICYFYEAGNVDHYSVVKKIDSKYIYFWDPDPNCGPEDKYSISYFEKIWKTDPRYQDKERRWIFAMKK
ncbi:MAG: C39 family peptidase [Candidatus Nanoarchaeia archaeon]|nr:C39 family peptidase [Candidatus Nanoarchaeia archaeon]